MDFQPDLIHADPSRLLVAAEPGIDPHRLVSLCCKVARGDAPSVTLLIPEGEGRAGNQLLGRGAVLFQAAGLRLEDVVPARADAGEIDRLLRVGCFDALLVCAAHREAPAPTLSLVVHLAGERNLTVLGADRPAAWHVSWLRRLIGPLLPWPRPREAAR